MTEKAASWIWSVISAILCVLTFNFLSISQNWEASIGLGFLSIDTGASNFLEASLLGPPVISIGLLITSYVGIRYVKLVNSHHDSWDTRVPVRMSGIQPCSQESKVLSFFALLFFLALPIYVVWHLLRKFTKYGVACEAETGISLSIFSFTDFSPRWNHQFLVGIQGSACEGLTFEPLIQPVLMIIFAIFATVVAAVFFYFVLKPNLKLNSTH